MDIPVIETRELTKEFRGVTAVSSLNLSIGHGEVFGLLGPDGAGKTTTIRMLTGILSPTSGEIKVLGQGLPNLSLFEKTGYVSQVFSLYDEMTVAENIDFFARIYNVPPGIREDRGDKLLEFTRLTPFVDRSAGKLSGGMKQKLSLICALIHEPEILFLDEPTAGVDPLSRREFWNILKEIAGKITIFMSTHYMDEAERCSRLGLLHRGRLIYCDDPQSIKKSMKKSVFEITCHPKHSGVEVLKADRNISSVELFGDKIHVMLDSAGYAEEIKKKLEAKNVKLISMERISPSLEDVFISLVEEK